MTSDVLSHSIIVMRHTVEKRTEPSHKLSYLFYYIIFSCIALLLCEYYKNVTTQKLGCLPTFLLCYPMTTRLPASDAQH